MCLKKGPQGHVIANTQRDRLDDGFGKALPEQFCREQGLTHQVHSEPAAFGLHYHALAGLDLDRLPAIRYTSLSLGENDRVHQALTASSSPRDHAELLDEQPAQLAASMNRTRTGEAQYRRTLDEVCTTNPAAAQFFTMYWGRYGWDSGRARRGDAGHRPCQDRQVL
jgi:hypothetical protein